MKTARNVYRRFIEFEERAAAIYLRLASHFREIPTLAGFWLDMALQEKQHAGLLEFCLREAMFASELPDPTVIQKLLVLFKRLEKRAIDPKLSVEEAFALAIELEKSEMDAIYRHLTTTLHSSMYLFKRKIATSLPNHAGEVIAAAHKYGVGRQATKELERLKKHYSSHWKAVKAL